MQLLLTFRKLVALGVCLWRTRKERSVETAFLSRINKIAKKR